MKTLTCAVTIVLLSAGMAGAQSDYPIDPKSILGMLKNIENSTRDSAATLRRLEIQMSRQNQPKATGPFLQPIVPPYVCNITALGDSCKGFAEGICKSLNFAKAANVADQVAPLPPSAMIPGDQHTITAVTCTD